MATEPTTGMGTGATRVLAIIGLLAVIVIGMWGSVQVARAIPSTFSAIASAIVSLTQIFVPANETITLSAPSLSVASGQPVALSITHEHKSAEGTYTLRYTCVDGVTMTVVGTDGSTLTSVGCGTAFTLANGTSVTVIPQSTKNRFVDVEVFVGFTPKNAGTATVTGSTVLTIQNDTITTSPTTTNTTPTPTTPKPVTAGPTTSNTYPLTGSAGVSNPNGYVDLTARVIEVGVVDKDTGVFTASSTPNRRYRVAVRFAVENIGTKTSPTFTFSSVLPTIPPYTFFSQPQQALAPGDRIEFTMGFDSFNNSDSGIFIINVDPTGGINERNKNNNIIQYTVNVTR